MKVKNLTVHLTIISGLLLSLSILGVAQKISYDFVHGTDFSKYKTYSWKRAEKAKYPDPPADQIMMRSIDAELAKKGLTKTEGDPSDLYLTYQLAITEDAQWSSFTNEI